MTKKLGKTVRYALKIVKKAKNGVKKRKYRTNYLAKK